MRRAGIREADSGRRGAMNISPMIYVRIRQFIAPPAKSISVLTWPHKEIATQSAASIV
jgi:hypothetical protein